MDAEIFPPIIMDETLDITGKDRAEQPSWHEGYKDAVWELANDFSAIPERWIRVVAKDEGDYYVGMMTDTMYLVHAIHEERILDLLRDIGDEELGPVSEIDGTGILAWEIGGHLVLGIDGDLFYHWSKLYDALGLRWHEMN